MSHTVTIKTQIRDQAALTAACLRMGFCPPVAVTEEHPVRFYDGKLFREGWAIILPHWAYPIVVQPDGDIALDNYDGKWGDPTLIDNIKQAYAVEVTIRAAQAKGWRVSEFAQPDGSIRLQLVERL